MTTHLPTRFKPKDEFEISTSHGDNIFRATIHFIVSDPYEDVGNMRANAMVAASYIGRPESVLSISSTLISGFPVTVKGRPYRRSSAPLHRMERSVGEGDLAHGIVFDTRASTFAADQPVEEQEEEDKDKEMPLQVTYIVAEDGDLHRATAEHLMATYGLPKEWEDSYYMLFKHRIRQLTVTYNPQFQNQSSTMAVARLETSEQQVLSIMSAQLRAGTLRIPDSDVQGKFNPSWTMKEYMLQNNEAMAAKLSEMKPRHTMEDALDPHIATMKRVPFPTQAHMIQALINGFEEEDSLICSSDMGTGKSIKSLGVAHVLHEHRKQNGAKKGTAVLLSAPGITLAKWKDKEIRQTLPHAKTFIIKDHRDVLALYKKYRNGYRVPAGEIHFYLVGLDRSKLGPEPYYAGIWKRVAGTKDEYGFHCPDCGQLQMHETKGIWYKTDWDHVAKSTQPTEEELFDAREERKLMPNGLPRGLKPKWSRSRTHRYCTHEEGGCGTVLYRPAVRSREETTLRPRANISRVLKRFNGLLDLYICDEVHKSKGSGSGRGDAFASMVKAAKRNLLLTGTLVNGKSTSIKEILWRTDAKSLIKRGFSDETSDMKWARKYGKVTYYAEAGEDVDGAVVRKRNNQAQKPSEEPGIAPHMTAEFLLHKTGFMELRDLGLPLVELKEIPVFVNMDPEHQRAYERFHESLYDACKLASAVSKSVGAWSKFTPATLMYADRPDLQPNVEIGEVLYTAPQIKGFHSKERELVNIVRKELRENRGCVIYNTYTGNYRMNQHLQGVLKAHGIRSVILDEPNLDKRSEVLDELERKGEMVVITNMKNVEVGLDLLYWPTIINYQMSYEVSVFRQSNRRNWRIGQDRECRCYILAYNGSQQISQFMKVMAGRGHALMTEGRLDRSELAQFARDEQSSLATDLADCFATSEMADAWQLLASKDMEDLEIISEGNFKDIIKQRMKDLANETLRLCGVPVTADAAEPKKPEHVSLFAVAEEVAHPLFSLPDAYAAFIQEPVEEEPTFFASEEEGQLSFFDLVS